MLEFDHPIVGKVRMANSPLRMSDADTGTTQPSPALGQHTREFLAELGYAEPEIDAFEREGVVRSWSKDS
jgi:crotonobetainyl-CoA:carnitine CoA-transferase CaiB-like acyl-CoA transferase